MRWTVAFPRLTRDVSAVQNLPIHHVFEEEAQLLLRDELPPQTPFPSTTPVVLYTR